MGKLILSTQMTLGAEIGSPQIWGMQYIQEEHLRYVNNLILGADALLMGRVTYEHFSKAYPIMNENKNLPQAFADFIDRMNHIPKYVATTTLKEVTWNASIIADNVVDRVAKLKKIFGKNILKYGWGPLDAQLMARNLIDEFHLWIFPVALGNGQRMFEGLEGSPHLQLVNVTRFATGVVVLTYTPKKI